MDIDAEIGKAVQKLEGLQWQVQELQRMGVKPTDEVFNVLAEKAWQAVRRWEVLANCDWEEGYWIHDTKMICKN